MAMLSCQQPALLQSMKFSEVPERAGEWYSHTDQELELTVLFFADTEQGI